MTYSSDRHRRRSIRLKGYDYRQAGAYFVTICTQDRECVLGDVSDGIVRLNDAGRMAQSVWNEMPAHYPGVELDTFVIMPNHIHGIIVLVRAAPRGRPDPGERARPDPGERGRERPGQALRGSGQARGPAPTGVSAVGGSEIVHAGMSLGDVVHRFKTMTTKRYADGVKKSGWRAFRGRLWQRNYYDHIIRNERELDRVREYIANNPAQWDFDRENPVGPRYRSLIAENES